MIIEIFIVFSSALYAILHFVIIINLFNKLFIQSFVREDNRTPGKFSIIIAAKNEAKNLGKLIFALSKLNYPEDDYEVIIVDDNSTDYTYETAHQLISGLNNFSVVKAERKRFEGKRGALDYGISLAQHPNILITDADCIPEENWLKSISEKLLSGCDFVFGIAPFVQAEGIVNKISCYENFRNSVLAISAAYLGLPYTASARNLGFKKSAFTKIGGYKNTLETISGDDDLLLREAIKNKLKICPMTEMGSFVFSETKKTFKEYFSQRARHTQTSFYYPLKQKMLLAVWHTLNIAFVPLPLLILINRFFIIPFILKLLLDIITAFLFQKKFGYRFSLIEIICLQVFYEILLIVHLIRARFGRIEWK